ISTDNTISYNALQLGPDGRIYIADGGTGAGFLGVINNPSFDSSQVAFQAKPISLGTGQSNLGLPNFVANYFSFGKWGILDADTCSGSLTLFQGSAPDSVRSWTWNFGDAASGASNTASGQTVSHTFSGPGTYTVSLHAIYHCGVKDTTKQVTIIQTPIVNLGHDTTLCTVSSLQLNAGNNPTGSAYNWNTNAHTQKITVNSNGKYYVDVINGGCQSSDTINVAFINAGNLNLGNDTTLCNGESLTLNIGLFTGAVITWDNGSHNSTRIISTVNSSAKYFVDITYGATCKISDSVNVSFVAPPTANLGGPNLNLCQGSSKKIGSHNNGATYIWNTLATTDSITVNTAGKYWVDIFFGGCKATDSINVIITPKPIVNLGPDQTYCSGASVTLDAQNTGFTFKWFDASTGQTHVVNATGTYWVDVTDGPCTVRDSINLTFIPSPVVNLGSNTTLCQGVSKILNATNSTGFNYLWNDNSNAAQLTVSSAGKYFVKVFQGNCSTSDTINISYESPPSISLPPEKIFCSEDVPSITLFAGIANSYLWMPTGETIDSIHVSKEGIYTLQAKSAVGCISTASTNVLDICEAKLFVPNTFTPNNDGKNDEFQIFGLNITQFEIRIFDRWGELIFVSNDMSKSWDGKSRGQFVIDGAYAWKIEYSGQTRNGIISKVKLGDVTVLK
ncbi:MAG TPA: gliding motility-associated C-terminal domain-containing protein, partial [Cytophagaceae bacterium]|nr:gliding motility-associated C-terminal domain-containing protein [Cytophagaceae bacterium]